MGTTALVIDDRLRVDSDKEGVETTKKSMHEECAPCLKVGDSGDTIEPVWFKKSLGRIRLGSY